SDQYDRQCLMLVRDFFDQRIQTIMINRKGRNKAPFSFRFAMTPMIERIDGHSVVDAMLSEIFIAATMFIVTMNKEYDCLGSILLDRAVEIEHCPRSH